MVFGVFILRLLSLAVAVSGASYAASDATRYIISSEEQWVPTNPHEASEIRAIFADDFIGLIDGMLYTKTDAISAAKNGPGDVASERVEYVKVRFYLMTAIAQGQAITVYKDGRKVRNRFIDTWIFENGSWRIHAAADTDTPLTH